MNSNQVQQLLQKNKLLPLLVTLFLFLAIPITVYVSLTARPTSPKAAGGVTRGQAGDLWADTILGKRDFTEIEPGGYVNPQRLSNPGGAVVDRDSAGSTKGYLWIWSGVENRIVGVNLDNCPPTSGDCTGQKVIGQTSLSDYAACNGDSSFQNYPYRVPASASTLCGVEESVNSTAENLAYVGLYSRNTNLYVPDLSNHRVLIYYNPWGTDQVADEVIGQTDFTGNLCNKAAPLTPYLSTSPTNSSLCLLDYADTAMAGAGVTLDASGNIWVADNANNRVLRFSKQVDGTISKQADLVLGQTSFTVGPLSSGSGLNQLSNPVSLKFDPSGNLYVADAKNKRIMKYIPAQQITGGSGTVFASDPTWPIIYIGEVDTINNGIWLTGTQPFNIALYGFDGTVKKSIFVSQRVVGNVGLGKDGSMVATSPSQGTLYFNNPMTAGNIWDKNIFLSGGVNQSRSLDNEGVAIAGNQLFANDLCRVMVWNDPSSVTNGKPADYVLMQKDFNTLDCNAFRTARLKADKSGRVYIKTQKGIYIYQAPVTSGSTPIKIITDPIPTISGGSLAVLTDYEGLMGLTPQTIGGQDYLWVVDTNNNRVVRLRDPFGTPTIDVVVGQANLTSTSCNRGTTTSPPPLNYLCLPGMVSVDNFNNLYISDDSLEIQGNMRILMYTTATFPTGNTSVFFDATAAKSFPNNGFNNAFEVAFDSQNHMVVGQNSYSQRFLAYYLNPLDPASTKPNGFFKDFDGMSYGVTFDSNDNLYVTDLNRSRILIYKTPFVEPVGNVAPNVQITSHQNNGWYSGQQTFQATATDDYNSVARVEFYVDNNLISSNYFPNYRAVWNPPSNGSHTLMVKAYDQFERVGQSSITINTDNQSPGLNVFTSPANGTTVTGIVPLSVRVEDSVSGVAKVEFYIDNTLVNTDTIFDSYGFWWDTSTYSQGSHILTEKAYDLAGSISSPAPVTVNIDNTSYNTPPPPSGTVTTLLPSANGALTEWAQLTPYPAGQPAFQAVNETVPDEDWSTIYDNGWNSRLRETVKTDPSSIPTNVIISNVTVFARARINSGTSSAMKLLLKNGGSVYSSNQINLSGNAYQNYSFSWATNPATNQNWTLTDINNTEIGVQSWLTTLGDLKVTSVWEAITYTTFKVGDINRDGMINSSDLAILLSSWGSTSDLRADLNTDGRVNSADLAILLSRWGS